MKQKFIEWFTKNNNGCSPAMEDDRSFVYETTQLMFEAYQAGVAEGEARCAALAAENAGLKAGIGFFSYDSSGSYEEHDTADKAAAYAEDSISEYRDNAPDGWSDEVGSVVWGVILQRATMTGLRPVTEEDNVASHIEEFCDYTLLPVLETPATDAFLAEVRAMARNEGINYAAGRLAAAFNHGFVDKPLAEVFDVVRMILDTKEELANSMLPADDGLSGEYAETFLAEFAAQLRKGAQS